ncbi:hypothetical protein [Embleya sp. NPDC005575]|uniref:hypothetical protein n=1 Tax=Embleya sp. NPDC005575 TaxID=3156892 RepID=UPI0033BBD7C1
MLSRHRLCTDNFGDSGNSLPGDDMGRADDMGITHRVEAFSRRHIPQASAAQPEAATR